MRCRRSSAVCLLVTAGVGYQGSSDFSCWGKRSHVSQEITGKNIAVSIFSDASRDTIRVVCPYKAKGQCGKVRRE